MSCKVSAPDSQFLSVEQLLSLFVTNIIEGKDTIINKETATNIVLDSDIEDKQIVLKYILEDTNLSPKIRFRAAGSLGRIQSEGAINILHENLTIDNPFILQGIIRSLGRVGNMETYQKLAEIRNRLTLSTARETHFAMELIAHRFKMKSTDIAMPQPDEYLTFIGNESKAVAVSILNDEAAEAMMKSVSLGAVGVPVWKAPLYQFDCNGNSMLILMNRELEESTEQLGRSKFVLGAVVSKSKLSNTYSPYYLLLSTPTHVSANKVNLRAVTTNGILAFAGTGVLTSGQLSFHLKGVKRAGGYPMEIEGHVAPGGLSISKFLVGSMINEKNAPKAYRPLSF